VIFKSHLLGGMNEVLTENIEPLETAKNTVLTRIVW